MSDQQHGQGEQQRPNGEVRILRCDHVIVYRSRLSPLRHGEGGRRGAWLALTDTGEVRLYTGKDRPDFSGPFKLVAASPDELSAELGMLKRKARVRFGKKRRRIAFDGRERGRERQSRLLRFLPLLIVPHAAAGVLAKELAADSKAVYAFGTNTKRRRRARNAWFPVLAGAEPWPAIETNV